MPIVSSFQQGENVWYKANTCQPTKAVTFVMTKGTNTSYVLEDEKLVLVSNNQLAPSTAVEEDREVDEEAKADHATNVVDQSLEACNVEEPTKNLTAIEGEIAEKEVQPLRRSSRLKQQPVRWGFDDS